jgi:hypothetical protein
LIWEFQSPPPPCWCCPSSQCSMLFPKFSMFLRNFLIWEFRSPLPHCCYKSVCLWRGFWGVGEGEAGEAAGDRAW